MRFPVRLCLLLMLALVSLTGCGSLGYYGQAVNGELKILSERQPVRTVIENPTTPPVLRQKLKLVSSARSFAVSNLDLPQGGSYRSYVALDRAYPVWVVYAAPEFSLAPLIWCFPFSGCVPYRGYFHERTAESFATELTKNGNDIFVTGAAAYSTLGWFADPVYSSMLQWGDAELVGSIFHELAHQKLYVKDDAAFNESFADAVEDVGVARFFADRDPAALVAWNRKRQAQALIAAAVAKARTRLAAIYASQAPDAHKRAEKQAEFQRLADRYREIGARFGIQYAPDWLANLNNASLAALRTYDHWVPAFRQLLRCEGGDLATFYRAAARIGALPAAARTARLQALADLKPDETNASKICAIDNAARHPP